MTLVAVTVTPKKGVKIFCRGVLAPPLITPQQKNLLQPIVLDELYHIVKRHRGIRHRNRDIKI